MPRAGSCRPSRRGVDRNQLRPETWSHNHVVAPRAGAWIETLRASLRFRTLESPLAQGRGSKLIMFDFFGRIICRPSRRGVDRNQLIPTATNAASLSPLAQGRGSKQYDSLHGQVV